MKFIFISLEWSFLTAFHDYLDSAQLKPEIIKKHT